MNQWRADCVHQCCISEAQCEMFLSHAKSFRAPPAFSAPSPNTEPPILDATREVTGGRRVHHGFGPSLLLLAPLLVTLAEPSKAKQVGGEERGRPRCQLRVPSWE